jgi:hypothetical protein
MSSDENPGKTRTIDSVQTFAHLGYGLIFAVTAAILALAYVSETFRSMFDFGSSFAEWSFASSRLLLLAVTLVWVLLWIANTAHELDLWSRHLEVAVVKWQARLAIVVLAFALAVLLILTYDILLFSAYVVAFLVINLWTQAVSNDYFRRALATTRHARAGDEKVLAVLEAYWLGRPHLRKILLSAVAAVVLLAVVVSARRLGGPKSPLETAAIMLAVAGIAANEGVLAKWRARRDSDLGRALGEVSG